jgi:NAD(P)H-dependent FMN reductase
MKILAFGGSNSSSSINRKFAGYAASLFPDSEVELLDLNDFPMPLFSVDTEAAKGNPPAAAKFLDRIANADLLVISLAENNSSFNVGFKNIFDWNSRINPKQFQNKPMLLMASSPGKRGGASVLAHANAIFPFHGAQIKGSFSLPSFYENFDDRTGIINMELNERLKEIIKNMQV